MTSVRRAHAPLLFFVVALALGLAAARPVRAEDVPTPAALARTLAAEGDHAGAALEYRRLALQEPDAARGGGWHWMAGYEYWRAGQPERAEAMVDRAEAAAPKLGTPALLLRAETARDAGRPLEAAFYYDSLAEGRDGAAEQAYARRARLALHLEQRDLERAREALADWPDAPPEAAEALDRYAAGRDKRPRLGGVLGTVPGLGYAYAGEYASALRSLILNGIFIYGMVHTAQEEQWGAFAVISFFEFTWYSGSIYGGVDASHRYNRRRAGEAAATVRAGAMWRADETAAPVISVQFPF